MKRRPLAGAGADRKNGWLSPSRSARPQQVRQLSVDGHRLPPAVPAPSFNNLGYGEPTSVEQITPELYRCTFVHVGKPVVMLRAWCGDVDGRPPAWRWRFPPVDSKP